MKKIIKRSLLIIGGFFLLILALLIIIPFFIDVNDYKPTIEKKVSEMVNRPFKINGDIKLSLFPVANLAFSDLHLGNPAGFQEKDFLFIKAFDLRIKLLPLIKKEIQIKRFVIVEPQVMLIKSKKGQVNWEGMGESSAKTNPASAPQAKSAPKKSQPASLPIKSMNIEEFSLKKGAVFWIDHQQGTRKEVKELNLVCKGISFERPVPITLSALVDKKPVSMQGSIGPLGKEPGKGTVAVDLLIKAFNELELKIKGKMADLAIQPRFDLALESNRFSAKKLLPALGMEIPKTARPEALTDLAFSMKIKANSQEATLSDGLFQLDQSKMRFSAGLKEFDKPRIDFTGHLDQLNADHYLPPPETKPAGNAAGPAADKGKNKKTDYAPLRKMILNAKMEIGRLTVQKANLSDILMKVTGKNGIFTIDPFDFTFYQGKMQSRTTLDVSRDKPVTQAAMQVKGVQVGPLIRDLFEKDLLEGRLEADMDLKFEGDEMAAIRQTLNGKGNMLFKDGAIVGVDLNAMAQNIQAAFGQQAAAEKKPRTDFSEMKLPFSLTNGMFETKESSLVSPFIRMQAIGKANLVNESLDFRVVPKIVTTIQGQGDQSKHKGLTVPVIVSGTFSNPKFKADLEGMLKKSVEKTLTEQLLQDQGKGKKKKISAEDLLKGLLDEE